MAKRVPLTGNDAGAEALKDVNPDVAAVFPITPQTELMHKFASYVHDGVVDTELILVESEHSAQSACFGAAAAGARTVTAHLVPGAATDGRNLRHHRRKRGCRSSCPWSTGRSARRSNIGCDHSDSMFVRDSGWIQLFCENNQEVYDTVVQAFRIGEHKEVLLPVMVCLDGFIISHTMEGLELVGPEAVREFVGQYDPAFSLLDTAKPITVGPLHLTDYYFECKRQVVEAMVNAQRVIVEVGLEYGRFDGPRIRPLRGLPVGRRGGGHRGPGLDLRDRQGGGPIAPRDHGIRAGVLKLRCFRPFPGEAIAEALHHVGAVAVLDRSISYGLPGGPLFHEVRSFAHGAAPAGQLRLWARWPRHHPHRTGGHLRRVGRS